MNAKRIDLDIIESYRFMELPITAQNLYIHLLLNADDHGVVDAEHIVSITHSTIGDLNVLLGNGYIRRAALNDTLVMIQEVGIWENTEC